MSHQDSGLRNYVHKDIHNQVVSDLEEKLAKSERKRDLAVGALEMYGERLNWGGFDFIPDDGESFYQGNDGTKDIFIIQAGKHARQVLKEIKEDK